MVCIFAADHGVATRGVSAYPAEVTAQMCANFAAGGLAWEETVEQRLDFLESKRYER